MPTPTDDRARPDEPPPLAVAPPRPRRLAYLGTPDVAVPPLRALHDAGFEIALVVTRPDRRRGRGASLSPSPAKAAANELGLPVSESIDDVLDVGVDLGVVVAYGRIIARPVLEAVPMVNLHFSLLPRWRGAAPVERALLAGDERTGVCLMQVAEGLDTGGVYAVEQTAVKPDDTLTSLRGRLVDLGAELLVAALSDGLAEPAAQIGTVTTAAKIDPAELEIDWSRPAVELDRLVRLGGAWTTFRGKRLKVWKVRLETDGETTGDARPGAIDGLRVSTGTGALSLVEVQPEGKARHDARGWRNGARPSPEERLGS